MSRVRDEIAEQPDVLGRVLERNRAAVDALVAPMDGQPRNYVLIASRGSSGNAARYGQHIFGRLNRLTVAFASPSLHTLYSTPPRLDRALVIGISQSGRCPDIVTVVDEGTRQGQLTVAITNDPESPLAQEAQHVLPLHAGSERAVAATKTYTASLCVVADLAAAAAGNKSMRRELRSVPDWVARQIDDGVDRRLAAAAAAAWRACAVVGRGPNYGSAFEAALKIKELTAITAEPYSPADLLHGPIAIVEPGYPVVASAPSGRARAALEDVLEGVRRRGGAPTVLSDAAFFRSSPVQAGGCLN